MTASRLAVIPPSRSTCFYQHRASKDGKSSFIDNTVPLQARG